MSEGQRQKKMERLQRRTPTTGKEKKNSNRENDQILMICFLFIVTTIDHVASTHGSKDQ